MNEEDIEEDIDGEIEQLESQFTDFNKHDAELCGKLNNAKLRSHGISIPKDQLIGNRVYNEIKTDNHKKQDSGSFDSKSKIRMRKGTRKDKEHKSKPKYKDKRR